MKKIGIVFFILSSFVCAAQNSDYQKSKAIIEDLDSIVTPNGIQENYTLEVGGIEHWMYVRGQDKANPMILFVHGGPASPLSPVRWTFQSPMEEYFTMVNYDQRAAGKTYASNDTINLAQTIHIDSYVDDIIEIAEHLKSKYHKEKVILMGHSWGTVISMHAALKRPDLFYAYVGIGQVINTKENERLSFEYALAKAKEDNNKTALEELQSIAPYPGEEPITRERIIVARKWPQYYGGLTAYRHNSDYFFRAPLLASEYSEADVQAIDQGSLFTLSKILPEFLEVDFDDITEFPIPVFMFMGKHDYTTPSAPTESWINKVKAPVKKGIWFENSAHLIPMEEPGKMLLSLVQEVRPLAVKKEKK